jgi:hypothetical protein
MKKGDRALSERSRVTIEVADRNSPVCALGRREAVMAYQTLSVSWERIRPKVTILRSDGRFERAVIVERHPDRVVVLYSDGRREQHEPSEQTEILIQGS